MDKARAIKYLKPVRILDGTTLLLIVLCYLKQPSDDCFRKHEIISNKVFYSKNISLHKYFILIQTCYFITQQV